jgi:peptide/nickel transport system substrate-binding protein
MLARLPIRSVAELSRKEGLHIGRYAQPRIHQIALDGRNNALRNRSLRRGLSYALDRKGLLEETILGRAADADHQPADGVFPRGSYA